MWAKSIKGITMIYEDEEGFLQYDRDAWAEERTEDLMVLYWVESSKDGLYYTGMGGCSE